VNNQLQGRRVLVVEDEYFIAQDISNALLQVGAEIVGPASTLAMPFACSKAGSPISPCSTSTCRAR
jgi:hypothetical protein